MTPDITVLLKQIEDYLFPRKELSIRERALYYYVLRHTWLIERPSHVFGLSSLAEALRVNESTVRNDVRALRERGVFAIPEITRLGHRIAPRLPADIPGVLPSADQRVPIDLEILDFFTERRLVAALVSREKDRCFYCLRGITVESCALDHVVAQREQRNHSFRNVVAACHECNSAKQAQDAADFIRSLYRRGVLSQVDLEGRLAALIALQNGQLRPDEALCR